MTTVLSLSLDVSLDNGSTFVNSGIVGLDFPTSGYSIAGGILVDSSGQPVRVFGQGVRFPDALNANRRLKPTMTFSNQQNAAQTFSCSVVIY